MTFSKPNESSSEQYDPDCVAWMKRILEEQHVPWGAQTYARDLRRRLEELAGALKE